jgi:hypothetical protein
LNLFYREIIGRALNEGNFDMTQLVECQTTSFVVENKLGRESPNLLVVIRSAEAQLGTSVRIPCQQFQKSLPYKKK